MPKTTITVDGDTPNVPSPQTTPQALEKKPITPTPQTPSAKAVEPMIDYKAKYEALVRQNEINQQLSDIAPEHQDLFKMVLENVSDPAKIKAELLAKNSAYKKSETSPPSTQGQGIPSFQQPDLSGSTQNNNEATDTLDDFLPKEVRIGLAKFKKMKL